MVRVRSSLLRGGGSSHRHGLGGGIKLVRPEVVSGIFQADKDVETDSCLMNDQGSDTG